MFFPLLATYIYIKQKCNFTVSFNNISTHFHFIIHDSVLKAKKIYNHSKQLLEKSKFILRWNLN